MTDQYRPRGFSVLPMVVKNLLIINILVFFAQKIAELKFGLNLADMLGLHYPGSMAFKPWQFISYMFLHGDFMHLFFNMFALWMFGYNLENVWGPRRFLVYYFITGIGAALVHYLVLYIFDINPVITKIDAILENPGYYAIMDFISLDQKSIQYYLSNLYPDPQKLSDAIQVLQSNPDNKQALIIVRNFMVDYREFFLNQPNVIGASGAVFGILLAYGMLFPNTRFFIIFLPFYAIKAKYLVIFYGLAELWLGLSGAQSNVAHFAHLGGMVFGFFLILYWKKKGRLFL